MGQKEENGEGNDAFSIRNVVKFENMRSTDHTVFFTASFFSESLQVAIMRQDDSIINLPR